MGWVIADAFCPKERTRANPNNCLEILVSSSDKESIAEIEKFMQYARENAPEIITGIKYANIKGINMRYTDKSGKLNEIYTGNNLNEEMYSDIISKIKN